MGAKFAQHFLNCKIIYTHILQCVVFLHDMDVYSYPRWSLEAFLISPKVHSLPNPFTHVRHVALSYLCGPLSYRVSLAFNISCAMYLYSFLIKLSFADSEYKCYFCYHIILDFLVVYSLYLWNSQDPFVESLFCCFQSLLLCKWSTAT